MKQKHSTGPDGEQRNPPTSGRGRGRPRKNPYQRLDPRSEDFFKAPEREGGPVDPLCCFQEVYSAIFKHQYSDPNVLIDNMYNYPIYQHLSQFSSLVDDNGKLKNLQTPISLAQGENGNNGYPMMQQPVMDGGVNPQTALASADKPTTQSTGAKPNGVGEKVDGKPLKSKDGPEGDDAYEGGDKESTAQKLDG